MLEAALEGLLSVLVWPASGYLLLGIGIGLVVGILPGLGGAVTLALMIPFTYPMSPPQAFAFLLGMLAVTGTAGDVTATLFGVPGEATSAANVLDGYPMTKKGQGGVALGAVLSSSLVGGIFGGVVLLLFIPIIRPVVLSFGSPEFFMLIVLGLTFLAALGTGAMIKSGIAALFGLLLSSVGVDALTGVPRYTLGLLSLWDGIGLVPVALGLFALPELVDLSVRATSISEEGPGRLSGVRQGVGETFKHWGLALRTSGIGAFVGMLPGLGSSVAQWVAYAHAVQTSPRYDSEGNARFGHGAIEGVIAPGAVNNSKEGGSLIPTVAFGVPGSLTAAILLGAFLIHGLQPGPEMLTEHLSLTMSFVWVIIIANIVAVSICLLLVRVIVKATRIRAGIIVPCMLILLFAGAFASRNNMVDVVLMLVFGVLGVIMLMYGWPRAPMVLGLVLGPLAENYLFRSMSRYGFEWMTKPIVIVIFVLCVVSVIYSLVRKERAAGRVTDAEQPSP